MSSNKTQDFSYYIQYFMNLLWVKYNKTSLPLPRRNWAMAVIALGMTMAVLDGLLVNVAFAYDCRRFTCQSIQFYLGSKMLFS